MTFPKSSPVNQILPAVGYRDGGGSPGGWGTNGRYWSSTPTSDTNGYHVYFTSSVLRPSYYDSSQYGFTVRCVAK
jgi:hypothetical protein